MAFTIAIGGQWCNAFTPFAIVLSFGLRVRFSDYNNTSNEFIHCRRIVYNIYKMVLKLILSRMNWFKMSVNSLCTMYILKCTCTVHRAYR